MSADTSARVKQELDAEFKEEIKRMMLKKLSDTDWIEQCRLKCRAYIENNQTKFISLDEVVDFIYPDAQKSFPESIRAEMSAIAQERLESILLARMLNWSEEENSSS